MKVLVQWALASASGWEELDSADFERTPQKPVPNALSALDAPRGWVNALNVQGVEFIGYDHYAVEPVAGGGCRVTVWKDDPDDLPDDSLGEFYARVWTFLPLAEDARHGGAWNTRQSQVVYAGPKLTQFYLDNPTENLEVLPLAEFVPPDSAVTRHGVWLSDSLMAEHDRVLRRADWREWTGGVRAEFVQNGRVVEQRPLGRYDKPEGTKTYGLRDSDQESAIHASVTHENVMTKDAFGASEIESVTQTGGQSTLGWLWSTVSGEPGAADMPSGNYRCSLDVSAAGADQTYGLRTAGSVSGHFARVNSSLTSDLQTFAQTEALFSGTGIKVATTGTIDPSSGADTDRWECLVAITRAASHGSQTTTMRYSADAFADGPWTEADTTAPVLSSQTVISITHEGGTPRVTTDEGNGTLYMVVVPNGDSPSVAQIKAGQNSSGGAALADESIAVSSTGVKTFSAVTGLEPETDYDVWFVHTDAASNDSTSVKADFATSAAPVFTPVVDAFRFYEDGTENGSTPLAAQDTSPADALYEVTRNSNDTFRPNIGGISHYGEAFVGNEQPLESVSAWLFVNPQDIGLVTGPITAVLYAADRTPGEYVPNGAIKTGDLLATSDNSILAEDLTDTPIEYVFTFTGGPTLTGNFVAQITWTDPDTTLLDVHIGEFSGVKLDSNLVRDNSADSDDFHFSGSIVAGGFDVSTDRQLHLRYRVQETTGGAGLTTDDYGLQYRKNGGTWTNVTASSANVQADTGSALTDGSASTNRATNGITDGTGSFVAGEQEEANGVIEDSQLTASNFTEHVWALKLIAADLADADLLEFRVTLNGGDPGISNTVTPSITVSIPAAGNDQIAGSADQAFTNTGTLTGSGALAGTGAQVFANTATLQGDGELAGEVALGFSNTGTLTEAGSVGELAGVAPLTFTGSGVLDGAGELDGAAAQAFDGTATLTGIGALSGVVDLAFGEDATLTGLGELAGGASLDFDGVAALSGVGDLAGSADLSFSNSGTLRGLGQLSGSSPAAFSNEATLFGLGALAGEATLAFVNSGTLELPAGAMQGIASLSFGMDAVLSGTGELEGTADLVFANTAVLVAQGALAGVVEASFVGTGILTGRGALAGVADVGFANTATLTELPPGAISGVSGITFLAEAALTGTGALSGVAALAFSIEATPLLAPQEEGPQQYYGSGRHRFEEDEYELSRKRWELLELRRAKKPGPEPAKAEGPARPQAKGPAVGAGESTDARRGGAAAVRQALARAQRELEGNKKLRAELAAELEEMEILAVVALALAAEDN